MKTFNQFINESLSDNLKIIGHDGFYDVLLDNEEIGSFILVEFGNFMKFSRIKNVFDKYNLNLNLGDGLELATFEIYEEYKNKGYGKKIMNEIIDMANEKNAKYIMLEAADKKTSSDFLINFYEKFGFKLYKIDDYNFMIKELY